MIKKIFKTIVSNWHIKLIFLGVAVILWLYRNYELLPEKFLSVPLKIKNMPRGLSIAEAYPDTVAIKVKGLGTTLQRINAGTFIASIDARDAVVGENRFLVKVKPTRKVKNLRIISINPDELKLKLDKYILKEVPVSVTIINSPAEGYKKTGESFYPKRVVIKGPYSAVSEVFVARTKPIDIGGSTGSIYKEVELDFPGELISTYNYKKVSVRITIKKNYKIKTYNNIRINIKSLMNNLEIKNKGDFYANVKIEGPWERLMELEKDRDFLFIDMADVYKSGSYTKKVNYRLPWNCKVKILEPDKIKVKIKEK